MENLFKLIHTYPNVSIFLGIFLIVMTSVIFDGISKITGQLKKSANLSDLEIFQTLAPYLLIIVLFYLTLLT